MWQYYNITLYNAVTSTNVTLYHRGNKRFVQQPNDKVGVIEEFFSGPNYEWLVTAQCWARDLLKPIYLLGVQCASKTADAYCICAVGRSVCLSVCPVRSKPFRTMITTNQ